jgi:hypothetical protein
VTSRLGWTGETPLSRSHAAQAGVPPSGRYLSAESHVPQGGLTSALERGRKMSQDKMLVLEVLQGMVRAGLAIWSAHPRGKRELQLLTGEIFRLNEAGIKRVR